MTMRSRAALLLTVGLVLAACGTGATPSAAPSGEAPASTADVTIVDFAFQPAEVSVGTGGTVTWTNSGQATHTVKWSDGTPESDGLASAGTYERTFDTAGTYPYVCGIHGSMTGSITVTE